MLVQPISLTAGAIFVFEGRLNRAWVDWLEKLPRLLAMVVGRLEESEKLPKLLIVRFGSSVLCQRVFLSSIGLGD